MAVNITISEVPIRERRLKAITGYSGSVKDLAARTAPGCSITNRERSFSQTNTRRSC